MGVSKPWPPIGRLARPFADLLVGLYARKRRIVRQFVRRIVVLLEDGETLSVTLRRIYATHHRVTVGLYSFGGCFVPGNMAPETTIGRYSFIAQSAVTLTRNHPLDLPSMHAYFFNPALGIAREEIIPRTALRIGNGVYLGHNAIVLPSVSSIGDGAFIEAGSVVNADTPPYAVVRGNPARITHYRYPCDMIEGLQASRWWDLPMQDLLLTSSESPLPCESGIERIGA